ncbi:Nickel transporter [Rubrivivax sp. A210]|uniref:HisA/HisF-related TIM barrel protein n=1 Tax=Rubrivivax sp. A210 TaxID=2772301 RepID=UPI0019C634B4|nr:HisA/HisF-related TIM barrel protein [Rubrivivax sp. A210]CAD5372159.1 Nickel transporter [Rubrivivax sp. A210]
MAHQDIQLIPVIDLLQGRVVRAVRGDRRSYKPVVSQLCGSSEPLEVATILCEHCDAGRLYVADLDALMGGVAQQAALQALLAGLPDTELWLDAGFADAAAAQALLAALGPQAARVVPVLASESLRSRRALEEAFAATSLGRDRAALSLDRRDGQRLDTAGCWDAPELWPQRVIVMTLERVGSGAGPDLETMAALRRLAPQARLVGAGGVRSAADLAQAAAAGAEAWLVASALHDGQLPRQPRRPR